MEDDYYDLLGIEPGAARDEIRSAYRVRKDSLDTSSETGRAEAARLNKAWNVLSDPYQRGRYDAQRELGDGAEIDGDEDVDVQSNGRGAARGATAAQPARGARQRRPVGPPTINPPPGTHFPQPKQRALAMGIDLLVLLLLVVVGFLFLVPAVANWQKPEVVDRVEVLNDEADEAQRVQDAAKKELDAAKDAQPPDQARIDTAQRAYDDAKTRADDAAEAVRDESQKLFSIQILVMGLVFLVGLVYLVVPSVRTGATVGKRFQHLEVRRDDGSRLRLGDALRRYGSLVLITFALMLTPLALLGAPIVLFGVMRWMSNPNMQGLHDRMAHTIVVSNAGE
jgi:uncharacterized RDD family membrane protein YckC